LPKAESQRTALAQQIGTDGLHLLAALERIDAPPEGKNLESVQVLRQVWQQYYELSEGEAKWRAGPHKEDGEGVIRSPYDPEAQTGKKRETTWLGYKVHLTETCGLPEEPLCPHLIVQVQTTVAPIPDAEMTAIIQQELVKAALKPEEQIVDTGYVDADLLSSSSKLGIKLVGPTMPDSSWQAKAGKGFDLAHFSIDWSKPQATCPPSAKRALASARQGNVWKSFLPPRPVPRVRCARIAPAPRQLVASCMCVPRQIMKPYKRNDKWNRHRSFGSSMRLGSGIEGTLSQGVRGMGMRRSRYDGLARTHVQHVLTAVAINLVRIDAVLTHHPRGKTRRSHFANLASIPAVPDRIRA
jgi:transposase